VQPPATGLRVRPSFHFSALAPAAHLPIQQSRHYRDSAGPPRDPPIANSTTSQTSSAQETVEARASRNRVIELLTHYTRRLKQKRWVLRHQHKLDEGKIVHSLRSIETGNPELSWPTFGINNVNGVF
jgi:hypothetical protein